MSDWCILRTAPSRTLGLATALVEAGYEAWTPRETYTRRKPRSKKTIEVTAPTTPSLVFAGYDRISDLVALSRSPAQTYLVWDADLRRMVSRGVPYFTVFRYLGGYPRVSDSALDPLRLAEQRGRPRKQARRFAPGDEVRAPGAGFEGLVGSVEAVKGRYSLVIFPGFSLPVMIEPRDLLPASVA